MTSIVLGHIAAVYLADVRAHQILETRGAALRSQVPLTALMVVYTFVSLTILAEPIVERRARATDRNGTEAPDHPRRRAHSRAWDRPVATGWGGPIRHLEIDLPRARLGIS